MGFKPGTFPPGITFTECIDRVYQVFKGIINDLLGHLPDEAHARLVIVSPALPETPISTSYQKVRLITPELVITHIAEVAQSKRAFLMDHAMTVHVMHTLPIAGNGRKSDSVILRDHHSVYSICRYDNLCLSESIVFGIAKHTKTKNPKANHLKNMKDSPNKLQRAIEDLHAKANIPIADRPYTLKDVRSFQSALVHEYQIVIVSSTAFNRPVYTGTILKSN